MIVMFLILFLAITTQSSVLHYNLSNNDYSIKLLCMKCIMFCKFIGGETAHRRCLVYWVKYLTIFLRLMMNQNKNSLIILVITFTLKILGTHIEVIFIASEIKGWGSKFREKIIGSGRFSITIKHDMGRCITSSSGISSCFYRSTWITQVIIKWKRCWSHCS